MSGGGPAQGEASPGDHLQSLYHYWLVGYQLEHLRAPWRDPYTFQPEAKPQPNFAGWPFGFLFWPLGAVFGLVGGWNALQLVVYVLAGLFACAWLRELGLPRGPALAGGLAFAIAPYRVQQSVGHLLGPISILLPLSLWAFERGRRGSRWWLLLSAAAIASIPLSGQVHLALGAIPFFLLYAVCRARDRNALIGAGLGAVAAVLAGVLVRETLIKGSTEAGGRSSPRSRATRRTLGDFISRHVGPGPQRAVRLPRLARRRCSHSSADPARARAAMRSPRCSGSASSSRSSSRSGRTRRSTRPLWHALPPFRFRACPSGCCRSRASVHRGARRVRARARAHGVVASRSRRLFVDLHVQSTALGSRASERSPITARARARAAALRPERALRLGTSGTTPRRSGERPGRVLRRPRRAPAKRTYDQLQRLNCGDWSDDSAALLDRLGVQAIAVHPAVRAGGLFGRLCDRHSRRAGVDRPSSFMARCLLFERGSGRRPVLQKPDAALPNFCVGWYDEREGGRYMSETHAALWVYGRRRPILRFAPTSFPPRVTVHPPNAEGWRLVTVDVEQLRRVPGVKQRVGARLLGIETS
jgi:hypothetical protein